MGRGKKDRLRQRRGGGTPLKVAIVTAPSFGASGVSLARDVELVKASALYADQIELVSVGAVMIASAAQLAGGGHQALVGLVGSLDDATLRQLGGGQDLPENWREIHALLSGSRALPDPATEELAHLVRSTMAETRVQLAGVVETMMVDSGAGELMPAIDSGLVTLSASGFTDDSAADSDAVMHNWLVLLRGLLVDRRTRLVLDDQVGSLASSLVREGQVEPHRLTIRHAGEAAVGSGLVARLPAFPDAPLDEILDLRDDLAGPLGRYRAAVVRLSDRLHAGPFDEDLSAEMDDLWTTDVQPALDDMGEGMNQHGLIREIARTARQDVRAILTEGVALYVGLGGLASVNDWLSGAVGLAGTALTAGGLGYERSAQARDDLRGHDLFYLYEVDRRLSS